MATAMELPTSRFFSAAAAPAAAASSASVSAPYSHPAAGSSRKRSAWVVEGDETLLTALWEQMSLKRQRRAVVRAVKRGREDDAGMVDYVEDDEGAVAPSPEEQAAEDELVWMCRDVLSLHPGAGKRTCRAHVTLAVEEPSASAAAAAAGAEASGDQRLRVSVRVRIPDPLMLPGAAESGAGLPPYHERSLVVFVPRDEELMATLQRALLFHSRPVRLGISDRQHESADVDADAWRPYAPAAVAAAPWERPFVPAHAAPSPDSASSSLMEID